MRNFTDTPMPPITIHTDDKQFCLCLPAIIVAEGYPGNSDDPNDTGGRTHAGIIQTEYDVYRQNKGLPTQDVYLASWDEVVDIYYISYWMPFCPLVWCGVNQMLFDQSVNEGPVQAARNLQRALNSYSDPGLAAAILRTLRLRSAALVVDGHIGPATLGVLNALNDRRDFLKAYYNFDISFYRQLTTWKFFGPGWTNRANAIYQAALELYNSSIIPSPKAKRKRSKRK
jgi:lysozyme family protein